MNMKWKWFVIRKELYVCRDKGELNDFTVTRLVSWTITFQVSSRLNRSVRGISRIESHKLFGWPSNVYTSLLVISTLWKKKITRTLLNKVVFVTSSVVPLLLKSWKNDKSSKYDKSKV